MASKATIVQEAVLSGLRGTGAFAAVVIGPAANVTAIPRASVTLEGVETFASDEVADEYWHRVRMTVELTTRDSDAGQASARLGSLMDVAEAGILTDVSQGGICRTLPIGKATEVAGRHLSVTSPPHASATLTVRCHFASTGGS
jgi:hypothetical protein